MNRSLHTIALCLLSSTATYGMDSRGARVIAQIKNTAQTVGTNIKHTAHTTGLQAVRVGQKVVTTANNAANAIATNYQTAKVSVRNTCQTIIDSERIKTAQALLNSRFNETCTYAKENPTKSALIVVGASVIAYKAYTSVRDGIKKAYYSWKKHYADHTTFCNCCGREIAPGETKHSDPKSDTSDERHVWICDNCHGYTTYNTNNGKIAYWQVRDN